MAEPKPEDIELLVNLSSLHPSEAIKLLKAHNNDLNAAALAFFDHQNQYPSYNPVVQSGWDESAFHSDKTDRHQQAFTVNPQDTLKPSVFSSAPSRPPSRASIRLGQSMSQAGVSISNPQEARDLDQALKMSMMNSDSDNQGQMTGVTNASAPHFGPARQEHYDKNWQMTVPGDYTKEIWLNPEPADRKRDGTKPAFLRPSTQGHRLPGLFKILQTIPLTREAMVCRDLLLSDYGRHPEWWDGISLRIPESFHEADDHQDHDLEEVVYETQRLVAFLGDTERAYGSVDSLVDILRKGLMGEESMVSQFLKGWQVGSEHVEPKLDLQEILESVAINRESDGLKVVNEVMFTSLLCLIDEETADKGRTLYDVVDDLLWTNNAVTDAQDIFLETVADVFIMDVKRVNEASSGLGIRIPAVLYLDRYLQSSVDEMKNMRRTKAAVQAELDLIEEKIARVANYQRPDIEAKSVDGLTLLKTASTYFESSRPGTTTSNRHEEQAANAPPQIQVDKEMKLLAEKVSQRLQSLEDSRNRARAKLEEISKLYTKPAVNPQDPPHYRWTLRGVCSDPKTVYVLEKTQPEVENDMLSTEAKDWQWWKITYVGSDSQPVSQSKVREIEVLKAAKDESNAALLVYASGYATTYEIGDLPSELRNFVKLDNQSFRAELEKSGFSKPTTPKRKSDDAENDDPAPNYWGLPPLKKNGEMLSPKDPSDSNLPPPYLSNAAPPTFSEPENPRVPTVSTNPLKSHDEAIPISQRSTSSTIDPGILLNQAGQEPAGQEMEDKGGMMGIMQPKNEIRGHGYSLGSYSPEIDMDDIDFDMPQIIRVEYDDDPEDRP